MINSTELVDTEIHINRHADKKQSDFQYLVRNGDERTNRRPVPL